MPWQLVDFPGIDRVQCMTVADQGKFDISAINDYYDYDGMQTEAPT